MSTKKEKAVAETDVKEEKSARKENTKKQESIVIYVGPTSKRLTRYASFTAGLPTHMDEHFKECPALKKMFIPVERFSEFEQQVNDSSSVEHMLYTKVADYFKGGNE